MIKRFGTGEDDEVFLRLVAEAAGPVAVAVVNICASVASETFHGLDVANGPVLDIFRERFAQQQVAMPAEFKIVAAYVSRHGISQ